MHTRRVSVRGRWQPVDYRASSRTTGRTCLPSACSLRKSAAGDETVRTSGAQTLPREASVRVPASRLDRLVSLVGELVMNQSRLVTAASRFHAPELAAPVEEVEWLVAELRDDVLQIRMMPIGTIFGRYRRLVHDLSMQLGKEIDLITEGEETELDKSILDALGEPLVHLLRNSIDHGIEVPQERRAKGKPRRGTIRLLASHRGSDVVVSIGDDGAGLDREAIRAKAIARQIIAPDANLSDKEILNLVLLPGFSTAETVTSVSGRGVGMDVVKRQIDALRGLLSVASEPGKGACVSLTLPLTLAIIDGLLVEAGESQFIVPMALVTENTELPRTDRTRSNGRNLVAVRGELIPYIDLRETFRMDGHGPAISKIVLVRYEEQRVGLVVDRVMGTHQTVIQALGRFFRNIEVVSGSTVMGDGRVALIIDVASIVRLADRQCRDRIASSGEMAVAEIKTAREAYWSAMNEMLKTGQSGIAGADKRALELATQKVRPALDTHANQLGASAPSIRNVPRKTWSACTAPSSRPDPKLSWMPIPGAPIRATGISRRIRIRGLPRSRLCLPTSVNT